MTALLLTGTGPGVGTTALAGALSALALDRGASCTVVVPAVTGVGDDAPSPVEERLVAAAPGVRTVELARYPDPLPPAAAARRSGRPPVDPAAWAAAVLDAERSSELVLVLAAGGLLVRHDDDGTTPATLARALRLPVVLAASAGPGGVNAAALTLEAVAARGLELLGVVVGRWPGRPGVVERSAVADLEMLAARPLLGALPDGLAPGPDHLDAVRSGLGPVLGGTFDAAALRRRCAA